MIPRGLCGCGCGQAPSLAKRTEPARGRIRGEPLLFVKGHWSRVAGRRGPASATWKGGRRLQSDGYIGVLMRDHPRAAKNGYVREHILVVENAIGHALPPKAEVHHVDADRANNANGNLVACQDRAYHLLLHKRTRAFDACGDPNAVHCTICKGYDRQAEMRTRGKGARLRGYHPNCVRTEQRRRYSARSAQ